MSCSNQCFCCTEGCCIYTVIEVSVCDTYRLSFCYQWITSRSWQGVLNTTLCDKVCHWLATGQWFSLGALPSSTSKTDCHNITEIFLKVVLNTINQLTNRLRYFSTRYFQIFKLMLQWDLYYWRNIVIRW